MEPLIPDATIAIAGLGNYTGPIRDLECDSGNYPVSISAPRYRNYTQVVTVPPGDAVELKVRMQLDADAFINLVAEMNAASARKSCAGVVNKGQEVLRLQPDYKPALALLVKCYFATEDYGSFFEYAKRALSEDVPIEFLVLHRHTRFFDTHPMNVLMDAGTIRFDPMGKSCTTGLLKIPAAGITHSELTTNRQNELLLSILVKDAEGRNIRLDFADAKSEIVDRLKGLKGTTINPRPQSRAYLSAIRQLLEYARSRVP
jgi:hypothetical protein